MVDYSMMDTLQAQAEEHELRKEFAAAARLYEQISALWAVEALAAEGDDRKLYQSLADYWQQVADRLRESAPAAESPQEKLLRAITRTLGTTGVQPPAATRNQVWDRTGQQASGATASSQPGATPNLPGPQPQTFLHQPKYVQPPQSKSFFGSKPPQSPGMLKASKKSGK